MKRQLSLFFAVAISFLCDSQVVAQTAESRSYYVVIGAFARVDNAARWTADSNQLGFNAQYALNTQRKLHYVYVMNTTDRRAAFAFMIKLRAETKYKDAWVFIGNLGIAPAEPKAEEPPVEKEPEPVVEETPPVEEKTPEPVVEEPQPAEDSVVVEVIPEEVPEGKPFLFQLTNKESGNEVLGQVHVQETANARQYQAFNGNEVVYLKAPRNAAGTYLVVVQAPGFKQAKVLVDYRDPSTVATGTGPKNEAIVPIELTQSRKGDYIEFNHVRFYRNSTIFEPQSKDELDGLVDLMKNDPKYKIRVHAHCNGKNARDITTMGDSKDFFATNTFNGRETATDKRLTELRAEMVKRYLVENGIEGKRIKTKAEGGRVMIYPQNSTLASHNDRIEIEVLKGK